MDIAPFNPNAKCPKCGGDVGSEFVPHWEVRLPSDAHYLADESGEHIARTCLTCGYSWPEAPMDKETSE